MAFRRDIYYQALFERLQAKVPGIVTWSRRHIHFSRLPAGAQPACLVLASNQRPSMEPGLPTVWTLGADIWIWVRATGQEESLDTVLNDLSDLVEQALLADEDDTHAGQTGTTQTTLGGLVESVVMAGELDPYQEQGAEEASIIIPVDMVVIGDDPGV